jgi:hypothetical protein
VEANTIVYPLERCYFEKMTNREELQIIKENINSFSCFKIVPWVKRKLRITITARTIKNKTICSPHK